MSDDAKDAPLKPTHEKFAQEYVANSSNGTQAAINAGFAAGADNSSAAVTASRLLRNAKVLERIRELELQSLVSTQEVVGTLASHMRGDITDALDPEDPNVIRLKASGTSHLVKKIKFDKQTGKMTEIELHDSQTAARILGKYKGLEQAPRENDADTRRKREDAKGIVDRLYARAKEGGETVTWEEIADRLSRKRPDLAPYIVGAVM